MNLNTHVYCTHCQYFEIVKNEEKELYPCIDWLCHRPIGTECYDYDCEDSKPFCERPMYKQIDESVV